MRWFLLLLLLSGGCKASSQKGETRRIVTLSPSLTQMVFALGRGADVVAVTRYDYRPKAVLSLPKVGGFLDVDLERLLSFRPDLVLLTELHLPLARSLKGAGVRALELRTRSIKEVFSSLNLLGRVLKRPERAQSLARQLRKALKPRYCSGKKRPRVLITLGRSKGSLKNLVGAGRGTYLHELLERAGGRSVFTTERASYPRISREELLGFKAQTIIDLVQEGYTKGPWKALALPGNPRIVLLKEKILSSPGVHMGEALELLHRAVCGE